MLVIDANIALEACGEEDGFRALGDDLAAPPLMWSEARANLHLALIKGEITAEEAATMHGRLEDCPVARRDPPELGRQTWEIAEKLGWGRTYDAEYVALAKILDCRLVTIDGRLRRGADRLGFVIGPDELKPEPDPSSEEEPSTPPETEDAPKG
jgi:predicted nucleic acid-binding protein